MVRGSWVVPWFVVMVGLFVAALWVGRVRQQSTAAVAAVQGAGSLHLEPTRFSIEVDRGSNVAFVFAELPGNYPVLSATQTVPVWRKIRVAPP
ncbi:MAG: hypothetical protein HUU55_15180 [Myxococcales bacterium]|nr:hypothetical protein [Myxococcales bacterium]